MVVGVQVLIGVKSFMIFTFLKGKIGDVLSELISHLNPLRAKLVESLAQLDRYRWSGHSVLMGKNKNEWQDRDYVLRWFSKKEGEAKNAYFNYVKKGIDQGRRPELVGGELIRSLGGSGGPP